jgi:hypothetical protein
MVKAQESLHEHIWREGELIGPTGPHEYLGFARACFNSGLCEAGSDSEVAISKEDWLACQRDLKLCQALAEQMKSEGQNLLINPPVEDKNENELTQAMRMADRLVQENLGKDLGTQKLLETGTDASFADHPDRKSTQGFLFKLFGGSVDWKSNKSRTNARGDRLN